MALNLRAFVSLDGSGFEAGMRRLESSIKGLVASAFTVGAIESLTRKTLAYAGKLTDLAARLGVSTDFLQEFQYVAKQTGTDLEKLTKVIETLREARDKALSGDKKSLAAFGALGVTPDALKASRLEDLISGPIAASLRNADVQGQLGAAWRQIGGKGAGELIVGFTEGFNELKAQAPKWSEDQIQQLDAIGDQFATIGDRILLEFGGAMIAMIGWVRKFSNVIAQMGSLLGAGTANWSLKDFALWGVAGRSSHLIGGKKFDEEAAGQAALDTQSAFTKQLKDEADARLKLRAARAKANLPGTVDPVIAGAPKVAKPAGDGDSLVRVGNFLGSNQNIITSIQAKQLSTQQAMLQELLQLRLLMGQRREGIEIPG